MYGEEENEQTTIHLSLWIPAMTSRCSSTCSLYPVRKLCRSFQTSKSSLMLRMLRKRKKPLERNQKKRGYAPNIAGGWTHLLWHPFREIFINTYSKASCE